jgi:CRP-like cAMP-binding protein
MDPAGLDSVPLFGRLSKKDRERVSRSADEVDISEGTLLVREGDFAYEFFAIQNGTATVERDGQSVATLGPGDYFGEIALLETERRTASVRASSPMQLIVMTGPDLRNVLHDTPELAAEIRSTIRERMGALPE